MPMTFIFFLMITLCAGNAFAAKAFIGKVANVDPKNNSLTISYNDPSTGEGKEIVFLTNSETIFLGFTLDQIQPGDEVEIEADIDSVNGKWVASMVRSPLSAGRGPQE